MPSLLVLAIAITGAGCGSSSSGSDSAGTAAASTSTATTAASATTSSAAAAKTSAGSGGTLGKISLTSSAFTPGGPIDVRYTCDGASISPPLQWHGVPAGTAELFLLAIDLSGSSSDAIQWAVAGIPPGAGHISAGALPAGAVAGLNSAGRLGWDGICGARGQLHHVAFLLYALRTKLGLRSGFNAVAARSALKGQTLATGLTLALYQRP